MSWVVAIPSYKRPTELQKKTLSTLFKGKIPKDKVYVFVVKEDEEDYKKALNPDYYNILIVGEVGLVNQRQFIANYFDTNQLIIFIDDDINKFVRRTADAKLETVSDLSPLFDAGFDAMKKEGANIWGVYSCANPFYMKPGYTTNLKYLLGAFYGIRNTKDTAYDLKYGDNQEDKERTLRYWVKDNIIVRFNDIAAKTSHYTRGGILAVQPDRIKKTKEATELIAAEFPTYIVQIYKKAKEMYDLKFRTGNVAKSKPVDRDIKLLTIRDREKYETVRALLLDELHKVKIPKIKGKINSPGRGCVIGYIGRTTVFGYGMRTFKGYGDFVTNARYPELFKLLVEYGNLVVPKDWTYQTITVNHNVEAKKHKDSKNCGDSIIIGIGNFTGGDIKVWNTDDVTAYDYNLHDVPLMFNGATHYHQTMPFEGERYTFIFYRQTKDGGVAGVSMLGV